MILKLDGQDDALGMRPARALLHLGSTVGGWVLASEILAETALLTS